MKEKGLARGPRSWVNAFTASPYKLAKGFGEIPLSQQSPFLLGQQRHLPASQTPLQAFDHCRKALPALACYAIGDKDP